MPNIAEWKSTNRRTSYPFSDDCVDELKQVFSDLHILVPAETTGIFLSVLQVAGNIISGSFSSKDTSQPVGSFELDTTSGDNFCKILSSWGSEMGVVVFGDVAQRSEWAAHDRIRTFSKSQSSVHPSCMVPMCAKAVLSLAFQEGSARGKVAMIEGDGILLVKTGENELRIDAVGSTIKNEACCDETFSVIKGINAAVPDQYGNISLDLRAFTEPDKSSDAIQVLRMKTSASKITFSLAT